MGGAWLPAALPPVRSPGAHTPSPHHHACSSGAPWNASTCEWNDWNGWGEAADKVLARRGYTLAAHPFRVYLTPPGACGFIGEREWAPARVAALGW